MLASSHKLAESSIRLWVSTGGSFVPKTLKNLETLAVGVQRRDLSCYAAKRPRRETGSPNIASVPATKSSPPRCQFTFPRIPRESASHASRSRGQKILLSQGGDSDLETAVSIPPCFPGLTVPLGPRRRLGKAAVNLFDSRSPELPQGAREQRPGPEKEEPRSGRTHRLDWTLPPPAQPYPVPRL